MRKLLPALCLVLLGAAAGDPDPTIQALRASRQGGSLVVSFELANAFDQPTLDRIHSGLMTEFRYVVQMERPRRWWFNPSLARTTLGISATYNAVTQEYLVNTRQDDRLITSRAVSDVTELQRAMTQISSLTAFPMPDSPGRTYVRVKAELGVRNFLLLFRRTVDTDWARVRLDQPE